MKSIKMLAAVAMVCGLGACVQSEPRSATSSDVLPVGVAYPVGPRSPALSSAISITRIAIGSCNHHDESQDIWPVIGATNPQMLLAIGDNVYGDSGYEGGADLGTFRSAYAKQASHPEFRQLVETVPTFATWDDHDYGPNDSGAEFPFRAESEQLFEAFWHSDAATRSRPGVYSHVTAGPDGQRVQVIMLDTRFFRSALKENRGEQRRYMADTSPDTEMLGAEQWQWLEGVLAEPADLRVVVSSIQVLTDAHAFEKWGNMPVQRDKLYRMLAAREDSGLVLVSGDRHSGSIYRDTPAALGEEVYELTSSSLNLAFVRQEWADAEVDPRRLGALVIAENFGLLDVDWSKREMALRLLDDKGGEIKAQRVSF